MTSDEIKKQGDESPNDYDTNDGLGVARWLMEIAYQLACHNEREDYRLFLLEEGGDYEPDDEPIPPPGN